MICDTHSVVHKHLHSFAIAIFVDRHLAVRLIDLHVQIDPKLLVGLCGRAGNCGQDLVHLLVINSKCKFPCVTACIHSQAFDNIRIQIHVDLCGLSFRSFQIHGLPVLDAHSIHIHVSVCIEHSDRHCGSKRIRGTLAYKLHVSVRVLFHHQLHIHGHINILSEIRHGDRTVHINIRARERLANLLCFLIDLQRLRIVLRDSGRNCLYLGNTIYAPGTIFVDLISVRMTRICLRISGIHLQITGISKIIALCPAIMITIDPVPAVPAVGTVIVLIPPAVHILVPFARECREGQCHC